MRPRRNRIPWIIAAVIALGGALRLCHVRGVGGHYAPHIEQEEGYYEAGLAMLSCHSLSQIPDTIPSDFRAPLYPSFMALTESFFALPSPYHPRAAKALLSTLTAAAACLLGWLLFSPAAGAWAGALLAFNADDILEVSSLNVHAFYGSALLALGIAAVLWLERRDWRRAGLLGLMMAATLLCRPAHFPFPLLFAAACLWRWKFPEGRWRALLPVAAAAALFLTPMLARNVLQFGRWSPFDLKGSYVLLRSTTGPYISTTIAEAYESAESIEPGFAARGLAGRALQQEMIRLALVQIARAPFRYAGYCLQRLYAYWSGLWLYLALGAVALWRLRGNRPLEILVLTAASLSGYAAAGGAPEYRTTALPLLCVIAGAGLASLLPGRSAPVESAAAKRRLRTALAVLPGIFAAVYAAMLVFLSLELREHLRPDPQAPAISNPCPDGRALHALKLASMQAGGRGYAAAVYAKVASETFPGPGRGKRSELDRQLDAAGLWLERAELEARTGGRAAALAYASRAESSEPMTDELRRRIVRVYHELKDYRPALAALDRLLRSRPEDAGLWLERAELEAGLRDRSAALESLARADGLQSLTAREGCRAVRLYRELGDSGRARALLVPLLAREPRDAGLRLESAELEARAGERELALRSLARAAASKPDDDARRRVAVLYRRLEDYRRALSVLKPLAAARPRDVGLWLERGELEAQAGERDAALRSAERVQALEPDEGARRRLASLYRQLQEPGRALALLLPLLELRPGDAGLWLERAELETRTGQREAAVASLGRAEAASSGGAAQDGELSRRVALDYQALGEHGRAVAVLDGLIRLHPGEGTYYSDRGLCEYLKGDAAAAIADLRTAIKLKPGFLPAYLTLGAIHTAGGRYAEALEVYDAALAREHGEEDASLRSALRNERKAIASKAAR